VNWRSWSAESDDPTSRFSTCCRGACGANATKFAWALANAVPARSPRWCGHPLLPDAESLDCWRTRGDDSSKASAPRNPPSRCRRAIHQGQVPQWRLTARPGFRMTATALLSAKSQPKLDRGARSALRTANLCRCFRIRASCSESHDVGEADSELCTSRLSRAAAFASRGRA